MIILEQYQNELGIEIIGHESIRCIDITFKGKFHAESLLPSNWTIMSSNSRMILINFNNNVYSESASNPQGKILNFTGNIVLKNARAYDINSVSIPVDIKLQNSSTWEDTHTVFSNTSDYYTSYSMSTSKKSPLIKSVQIVKNNLHTSSEEFYYKDGTPYTGDYHMHQDGRVMTGAEHQRDSVYIYRKDSKGKIVKASNYKRLTQFVKMSKNLQVNKNKTTREQGGKTSTVKSRGGQSGSGGTSGSSGGGGSY